MYKISDVNDTYADCENEQQFKKLYCITEIKQTYTGNVNVKQKIFCIETEETVAGFPDVMELVTVREGSVTFRQAYFYEFKCSDKSGGIKFQPTQPPFYRQNEELSVTVIAYNRVSRRVHIFSAMDIFDKESPYYTSNNRINLSKVEKELGI